MGDGNEINLPIEGHLRSSYKQDRGINSIIIEIPKSINGYKILLFEICNDNVESNMLIEENLSKQKHIKIYFQDSDSQIYLFEEEMPYIFNNLKAEDYSKANKIYDALWASELVNHEIKNLETNEEILSELGLNNKARDVDTISTWINPTTYYDAFYVGSDYVQCWSLPYVKYKYTNVGSGDYTWFASFKISEHMSVAGYTYYGNNVFEYRDVGIKFACGDKTTFIRSFQEGRMKDYTAIVDELKEAGSEVAVSVLKKTVTSLPGGAAFASVLNVLNSMSFENKQVNLGNEWIDLESDLTTAVGEKLSHYVLDECTDHSNATENGDYFTIHTVAQYEAATGNTNTVGALVVEFDKIRAGEYTPTHITQEFQLNYTAQP